ncbi:ATP-binding cassette domain-containing protein [Oceanobacillus luteolus]|uniref:ATP-binding cassette domain-containing protein n=1 Tax=Oceanobacillus luteolus TaxID=1274358 RepID=A0ABW4HV15_9BACI|nr:ATP-binding cassette domain-containing protein [Oceanobacillus luteolus]MCM3741323.1 ATP-binding cassette domain-containing protein [Oceanobacillus luteolus]
MSEYILRTKNLTKKYKHNYALENVNLNIKQGEIYGFIGQNGAGKSTLLRLITGLAFPTEGTIEWFGNDDPKGLTNAQKRMGALIESPALFPNMSAFENLEIQRIQRGIPGRESIDNILQLVGLMDTKNKKVKNFSMGMKQRLGIGIALLSDPEFLLLDEPINGLDPTGIVELRELIKNINHEKGITVLISSHILSELHLLATSFGIIHKGKLMEELTAKELDEKCRQYLQIKVDRPAIASTVLEQELATSDFEIMQDGTIKLYDYLDDIRTVSLALTQKGLIMEHLSQNGDSLESYFSKVIEEGEHE